MAGVVGRPRAAVQTAPERLTLAKEQSSHLVFAAAGVKATHSTAGNAACRDQV